ncbi:MAG TPA: hypothetical protein VE777_06895 [Gaiellales bacterium]|jgi:hypothetical protein|nr:hypothetical protein [Gaiellales bacterium]
MTLSLEIIRRLDEMRDPAGVLSIYVDGDTPDRRARLVRTVCFAHKLRVLSAAVHDGGPAGGGRALVECIHRIQPRLRRLLDDDRSRGRALFTALSRDDVRELRVDMPLETGVALDETAYVRPLVVAFDEGRPAGVASLHSAGLQLFEWSMGRVDEVESLELPRAERGDDDRRSRPVALVTARRVDPNRDALMRSLARRIAEVAETRSWRRMAVAGDPRLAWALRSRLDLPVAQLRAPAGRHDRGSARDLAAALARPLDLAQREYESALVARAVERALVDQTAVLGLPATLRALEGGWAGHLLFATDGDASREAAAGAACGYGVDPTERLIELALAGEADITPLEGRPGEALAHADGVAALLR